MSEPIRPPVPEEDRPAPDSPETATPAENAEAAAPRGKQKKEKEKSTPSADLFSWLQALTCALVVLAVAFTFVGRIIIVDGHSMDPTLNDKDLILLQCIGYEPKQGDVVVLRKDFADIHHPIVKRVIATAGQTVDIDFNLGQVYVDGELLDEDYINDYTYREEGTVFPLTVPEGEVFLMGDNRNHSNDSRDSSLGTVDTRLLIGKAVFLVFPGRDYLTEQREFGRIGVLK